jgi:hypothetical protein
MGPGSCNIVQFGMRFRLGWACLMRRDLLSEQCSARCKSTMQRCRRTVIGGGVCYVHGGNASQVKAAREARVIQLRAQLAAGEREPQPPRHPAEVLLSSIDGADQVMSQLRRDFAAGLLSPELSRAYGEALDRAGRLSKLALDASATERLLSTREKLTRDIVAQLIQVMDTVLADPRVIIAGDPRPIVVDAVKQLGLIEGQPAEQLVLTG